MIRVLLGLVLVVGGVAGALYFADHPGSVSLVWQGWQVDTSIGVLTLALAVAIVGGWIVLRLIDLVAGAPQRMASRSRERRAISGYRAISDGLVALAAGDLRGVERMRLLALKQFGRSGRPAPPLIRLLGAQAALLRHDEGAAQQEYTAMLESPETALLGLRGLIVQAIKKGDEAAALPLLERADRLRPATPWVVETMFALQTRIGAWSDALRTLPALTKAGGLDATTARRHRIALLLARAMAARPDKDEDGLSSALQAHRLDRNFAPAAIEAARQLAERGRSGRALKLLQATWQREPHPTLAAAFVRLSVDLPPAERLGRLEHLLESRSGDAAAQLVAAELALEARLWGEARRHLAAADGLTIAGPSIRHCQLMATLEEREGTDMAAALRWRAREANAVADPGWVCRSCGTLLADWAPHCPRCGSFGTLNWQVPINGDMPRAKLTHDGADLSLLPLLPAETVVGAQNMRASSASPGNTKENATRGSGA